MGLVFRAFPDVGVVAVFIEPNTTGAIDDIDAPRNAPAKNPASYWDAVKFHSSFNNLEVVASGSVTINHAATSTTAGEMGVIYKWADAVADRLLLDISSLGLTKEPYVLVSTGDVILTPGIAVQTNSGGRGRYVTPYSTTTEVRLWEAASLTGTALAAQSVTYSVLVFKEPAAVNDLLMAFHEDTGVFEMGFGRFRTDKQYLQESVSSPFDLFMGRSMECNQGTVRVLKADGTYYDPLPNPSRVTISGTTGALGSSIHYQGSWTGDGTIDVEVR